MVGTTISQCRSQLSEWEKLAHNWRAVEKIQSEAIFGRSKTTCECIRRDVLKVRHFTMDSYTWREVPYCLCATSGSRLIFSGLFPLSPRKPRTVLPLNLLRTLHEQCTSGSISKEAWAGGLRAALEADNKMVLPEFSHPVCPDIA